MIQPLPDITFPMASDHDFEEILGGFYKLPPLPPSLGTPCFVRKLSWSLNYSEQLEPTELNQARADRRETVARSRLNRLFHSNTHDLELSLFSSGINDEFVNNENEATPPQPATITTSTENCLICFDAPRTHAFLHFGLSETDSSMHYVACARCADKCKWATKGCPICRQPVVSVIKIVWRLQQLSHTKVTLEFYTRMFLFSSLVILVLAWQNRMCYCFILQKHCT